jgi:hypothetical protein
VIAYNGNKGRYAITREKFEEATKHLINQTLVLSESVLAAKQMDWKNIDGILLVGGSTRMLQVETELKKHTDKPILRGINVDEAVAIGAAIQADLDANEKQYTLESKQNTGKGKYTLEGRKTIKDVTGQSLGMIAENADRSKYINSIIIPRNTSIPSCEVRPFQSQTSTSKDNEIEVYVTQGESIEPSDCAILGKYVISAITHESGNAVLDIEYQYDKSGTVEVAAKQRSTGKKLAVRKEEPGDMSWTDLRPSRRAAGVGHVTVLIAIDTSGSMRGEPFKLAKQAAKDFLEKMDLTHCSIGIIRTPDGSDHAKLLFEPSQNAKQIVSVIDSLEDDWDGEPLFPLIEKTLSDVEGQRFAIILTDGQWGDCDEMVMQARRCHKVDIQIASLGFGAVNTPFLTVIANWDMIMTSPERFSESFSKIAQVITEGKTALKTR